MSYYNDTDAYCCEWLGNLMEAGEISPGTIDQRSITDVRAEDLAGFRRVHLFAGCGGWELALRLAGWDDREVWTGSCPCQPYSAVGKGLGDADPRNLWPEFFRLIRECRPECVLGEQVPSAIGHGWLDGVSADLEAEGYAVGAVVLGAHSVGGPHIRQRLYWLANANGTRRHARRPLGGVREKGVRVPSLDSEAGGLGDTELTSIRRHARDAPSQETEGDSQGQVDGPCRVDAIRPSPPSRLENTDSRREGAVAGVFEGKGAGAAGTCRLGDTPALRRPGSNGTGEQEQGAWARCRLILCHDGKHRRISACSRDEPLAYGVPRSLGLLRARLDGMDVDTSDAAEMQRILKATRRNRAGRLRAYGNSLCIPTAVAFIQATMEENDG